MASFNRVILLGNLTRDVEIRYLQSGQAVGKFGMAMNRRYTQNGESKESVCFVDCVAWGRTAEILNQYTSKGRPLFIEGRLEFSTWEAKDGGKRSKLEVVVENFQFVDSRGGSEGGEARGGGGGGARRAPAAESGGAAEASGDGSDFDGIPF